MRLRMALAACAPSRTQTASGCRAGLLVPLGKEIPIGYCAATVVADTGQERAERPREREGWL